MWDLISSEKMRECFSKEVKFKFRSEEGKRIN